MVTEEQFREDMRKLLEDHALSAEAFVVRSCDLIMNVLRDRAWRKITKEDLRKEEV